MSADIFWIDRSHEQVYIPDDGSFEFKGPSRAYGFEAKSGDLLWKFDCNPKSAKPFVPGALVGAIRAALRKSASATVRVASKLEVRGMVLDGGKRALTFEGAEVFFTRQEWDLFMILASHANRFLGAREILRLGWRAGEHAAEQLRTYIHRLRHKIEPLNLPCHLASEHGQGYCLMFD